MAVSSTGLKRCQGHKPGIGNKHVMMYIVQYLS